MKARAEFKFSVFLSAAVSSMTLAVGAVNVPVPETAKLPDEDTLTNMFPPEADPIVPLFVKFAVEMLVEFGQKAHPEIAELTVFPLATVTDEPVILIVGRRK